jgi:hypothetical protein
MPDDLRSSSRDALTSALAEELERVGARWVPRAVLEEYVRRARESAFAEAVAAVKDVTAPLIPYNPMGYGWNNAVSESVCRLESLRAAESNAAPSDRTRKDL